jgi:hypothetical protein
MSYNVYKITWAGLYFLVERFKTLKEAKDFVRSKEGYSLLIKKESDEV